MFLSVGETRNKFNKVIKKVASTGEEVIVTKDNEPYVIITPVQHHKRKLGVFKHYGYKMSDDFDAESDDINQLFYGE